MVGPRGKHEQGLANAVHRAFQHDLTQRFGEWRPAGLACSQHPMARALQQCFYVAAMGGLARAVDALERDELSPSAHGVAFRPGGWRWNRFTARLCSSKVRENLLLPSPRAT